MADNLKQKTISGVVWISIHKFAIIFLDFISGIVLARLLTPHDYGVVGMLVIFLALARTFIDGGFGSALIQKKQPTSEDYSTILYWNLGSDYQRSAYRTAQSIAQATGIQKNCRN